MRRLLLVSCIAALGCGEDPDASESESDDEEMMMDGGDVALRFTVPEGVRSSANLVDPLSGAIYGQLFLSADVSITGPRDGAEEFGSVEVTGVDLTAAPETEVMWTSEAIPPGMYTFLGFFDVDGNGEMTRSPEEGDPVTLPTVNKFVIEDAVTTDLTVSFDLIL